MAKYTSRYAQLSFYVDNVLKRFSNGEYNTINAEEIAVLDDLKDAIRVDEPKTEVAQTTETKPEAKPRTSTRKASAK